MEIIDGVPVVPGEPETTVSITHGATAPASEQGAVHSVTTVQYTEHRTQNESFSPRLITTAAPQYETEASGVASVLVTRGAEVGARAIYDAHTGGFTGACAFSSINHPNVVSIDHVHAKNCEHAASGTGHCKSVCSAHIITFHNKDAPIPPEIIDLDGPTIVDATFLVPATVAQLAALGIDTATGVAEGVAEYPLRIFSAVMGKGIPDIVGTILSETAALPADTIVRSVNAGRPIPRGRLVRLAPGGRAAFVDVQGLRGINNPGENGKSVGLLLSTGNLGSLMQVMRSQYGGDLVTPASYAKYQGLVRSEALYNLRCIAGRIAFYLPHGVSGCVHTGRSRSLIEDDGVETEHPALPTYHCTVGCMVNIADGYGGGGERQSVYALGHNCVYTPRETRKTGIIMSGEGAPCPRTGIKQIVGALNVEAGGTIASRVFHPRNVVWEYMNGVDTIPQEATSASNPNLSDSNLFHAHACAACKKDSARFARHAHVTRAHVTTHSLYVVPA